MPAPDQSSSPSLPQGSGPEAAPCVPAEKTAQQLPKIDEELRAAIALLVKAEVAREIASLNVMAAAAAGEKGRLPDAARRLSIREMVASMPPGLRSESSIRRSLEDGSIPGRKHRGRWSLDPSEVAAALERQSGQALTAAGYIKVWKHHEAKTKRTGKWPGFPGKKSAERQA